MLLELTNQHSRSPILAKKKTQLTLTPLQVPFAPYPSEIEKKTGAAGKPSIQVSSSTLWGKDFK